MMEALTQQVLFGNRLLDYFIWAGFFLGSVIVIKVIEYVIVRRLKKRQLNLHFQRRHCM